MPPEEELVPMFGRASEMALYKLVIEEGMSVNAALRRMREEGLGIRRQTALGLVRMWRGAEKAKDVGKYTPLDRIPGEACYVYDPRKLKNKYQDVVLAKVYIVDTGEEVERPIIVGRDEPNWTRRRIEEAAADIVKSKADLSRLRLIGVQYQYTRVRID